MQPACSSLLEGAPRLGRRQCREQHGAPAPFPAAGPFTAPRSVPNDTNMSGTLGRRKPARWPAKAPPCAARYGPTNGGKDKGRSPEGPRPHEEGCRPRYADCSEAIACLSTPMPCSAVTAG